MTTYLHRPVRRELAVPGSHLLQIVTMTREGLLFRPKGRRKTLVLPWGRAILVAARLEADRVIAERRAKRRRPRSS